MDYPLSKDELYSLVRRGAKMISHEEIHKFRDVDALLGPSGHCIIMYVTNFDGVAARGHWCYLQRYNGRYYYFDPYGFPPDKALGQVDAGAAANFGGGKPLTALLAGKLWSYSQYELQNRKGNSQVCGRLVALRAKYRGMSDAEFAKMLGPDPEKKSIELTSKFIG